MSTQPSQPAARSPSGAPGDRQDRQDRPSGWRRAWIWFKRIAPWALAAVVVVLLVRQGRSIDWPAALQALKDQPVSGLAMAGALTVLSYTLVASYDLVGRLETGHRLPVPRTIGIAAICYAFNLNLGSLVGALALKLRLYGRAGLTGGTAGRVIALTITTNWLGYLVAGGTVLVFSPPELPTDWPLSSATMQWVGGAMVAVAAVYVVLGMWRGRRVVTVRDVEMPLPGGRVVWWQLAVSLANWCVMGAIVWTLLQHRVDYPVVLGVLLIAAIAGVLTHVPAGLGVIEAVFLFSLGDEVPQATLLGALLAYRAIYYLIPLAIAAAGYGISEAAAKSRGSDRDVEPASPHGAN